MSILKQFQFIVVALASFQAMAVNYNLPGCTKSGNCAFLSKEKLSDKNMNNISRVKIFNSITAKIGIKVRTLQ